MLHIISMQRQNAANSAVRVILLIALVVILYIPLALLMHRGNELHGHVYAAVFPLAWVAVILCSWLLARTSRTLAIAAVLLGTASILVYYGLPRIAY